MRQVTRKRNATEATSVPESPLEKALWVPGLSVVYAISGFCALIYQTIWIKWGPLEFTCGNIGLRGEASAEAYLDHGMVDERKYHQLAHEP